MLNCSTAHFYQQIAITEASEHAWPVPSYVCAFPLSDKDVNEFYNDGSYTPNNRAMHAFSDAGVYAFHDASMMKCSYIMVFASRTMLSIALHSMMYPCLGISGKFGNISEPLLSMEDHSASMLFKRG